MEKQERKSRECGKGRNVEKPGMEKAEMWKSQKCGKARNGKGRNVKKSGTEKPGIR